MGKLFGNGNGKTPAEKDPRDKSFDARPPEKRAADNMIDVLNQRSNDAVSDSFNSLKGIEQVRTERYDPWEQDIENIHRGVEAILTALVAQASENKIDNIKTIGRSLTYAEMIELADKIWAAIPDSTTLTRENLPAVLHMFATS